MSVSRTPVDPGTSISAQCTGGDGEVGSGDCDGVGGVVVQRDDGGIGGLSLRWGGRWALLCLVLCGIQVGWDDGNWGE